MPTLLTLQETLVVDRLRRCQVATLDQLRGPDSLSHVTVFRALRKSGHYTSLNENSRWYTLAHTPHFDAEGLWRYRQLVFSRHGTLTQTLRVLVDASPAGSTVTELEAKVHTSVAILLCRLKQAGQITCRRLQRHAVYVAVEPERQAHQWTQRLAVTSPPPPPELPVDWDPVALLRLLVQMIQNPKASAAQLAHQLQAQGLAYRPDQVHQVIAFYDLKKKRHVGRG